MNSLGVPEAGRRERPWPGRVLVGFDGSPNSSVAIEWAAREVAARGSSLRISSSGTHSTFFDRHTNDLQAQRLSRVLHQLHAEHASLVVDLAMSDRGSHRALIEEAEASDLLVLAASTNESAKTVLLGSLARKAMRRSPCPVVVVRGSRTGYVRHIVLGVDGSSAAGAALDWACIEANLHRADLLVIHSRNGDLCAAEARCVLDLAVNECRERTGVSIRGVLTDGPPAAALIEASRTADIIAVGSRGRSGFRTTVFGSVALSVAEGADCPVAVTHPQLRRD